MEKKFLDKLQTTDLTEYPTVHNFKGVLEKALWALLIAKQALKIAAYLSPTDISEVLLAVSISCKPLSITRALARAGTMVDKKGHKEKSTYKIMQRGEDYLLELEGKDRLNVLYFDGKKPWSNRKVLSNEFIKSLKGEILIVDKYFGGATLDILSEFHSGNKIKFLTAKIVDRGSKFERDVKRFKTEYKHIEVKVYPKEYELHDRYLLTNQEFCFLGHGLRDIGSKESFILILRLPAGKEISNTIRTKFNERWVKAQNFI